MTVGPVRGLTGTCASIFYAFWNPYFYIEIYADYQNVRHGLAIYLLPIINAFGLPSRIIPGILADRFGW